MANAQGTVYWVDVHGNRGSFAFLFDDTYFAAPYTELLAFVQDLIDGSQAQAEKVTIASELDISGLTNPAAVGTGNYDKLGDQALLQWRAASGALTKITVPAPVDALFEATGKFAMADVDLGAALVLAIKATGEVILTNVHGASVDLQKGWRKDQKHS